MQVINNTNGLFENIYFQDELIDNTIKNHKELLKILIPKSSKVLIVSPFLMDSFKHFFKDLDIQNIDFELITTCKPNDDEVLKKPFQIKDFGLTLKELTTKYPTIHLINKLHSKIYLFYKDNSIILGIVTSANFTNNGLTNNHETGVVLYDEKILKKLALDIKDNLEYINLTETKINDLCKETEAIKKDKPLEKKEDINIDLLKYFDNNQVTIDRTKEFNFEEFINKQILKNTKINILDVKNLSIDSIPININMLTELKRINLGNNNISILQDELFTLNKLEYLDISDNKINYINSNIQNFQNLKTLKIYGNASLNISPQIFKLKNLKEIIVDKNIIDMNIEIFQKMVNNYIKIVDQNIIDLTVYIKKYKVEELIKCTECDEKKERISFESSRLHKKTNYTTGICRDCVKKDKNKRDKDLIPIIRERYRNLKQKAKKHNKELNFEVAKLIIKFKDDNRLKKLYSKWVASEIAGERNKDLKPNFYLINEDSLDFSLENIKITTTDEINKINALKAFNRESEATIQFTLGNEPLQIYISAQEARKAMKLTGESIIQCCNGKQNSAASYHWQYLKNINDKIILEKIDKVKKINQCYVDDEGFLFELADNKDLEDYLKIILYFKNYEDQEIKEIIQDTLLSNTERYLLKLFQKDILEVAKELNNNYSKIEAEYFDYLYAFVNIRYTENDEILVFDILKTIARKTKSKQLIEFLMENKTNQEILISILKNFNKDENNQYLVNEKLINRILNYAIKLNDISIIQHILYRENLSRKTIDKILGKFNDKTVLDTLKNTIYFDTKINKFINNKFGKKEEQKNTNIEIVKEIYQESKENDDPLRKELIEFRENEISKKFKLDENCILTDNRIEQFIKYKPLNREEFRENVLEHIKGFNTEQIEFLDDIITLIDITEEQVEN